MSQDVTCGIEIGHANTLSHGLDVMYGMLENSISKQGFFAAHLAWLCCAWLRGAKIEDVLHDEKNVEVEVEVVV